MGELYWQVELDYTLRLPKVPKGNILHKLFLFLSFKRISSSLKYFATWFDKYCNAFLCQSLKYLDKLLAKKQTNILKNFSVLQHSWTNNLKLYILKLLIFCNFSLYNLHSLKYSTLWWTHILKPSSVKGSNILKYSCKNILKKDKYILKVSSVEAPLGGTINSLLSFAKSFHHQSFSPT